MNEILWIVYIFINFSFVLFAYKKLGKIGVLIFIPLSIVVANIQVNKLMYLFGVETTMGNIAYGGIFLIEDILSENYGKKLAKTGVFMGFFTMLFMTIVMNLAIYINPSINDTANPHLIALFKPLYRLSFASLIAYISSSFLDIYLYQFIKKFFPKFSDLWIRNNLSTLISQILDNIIFTIIAFAGVYNTSTLISIMFSTYFLKIIISICDTPFVYLATYWKKNGLIKEFDEKI